MLATWRSFTWSSGFATGKGFMRGLPREATPVHRPVHQSHATRDEGGSLGEVGKVFYAACRVRRPVHRSLGEVGSLLRGWQNGKSGFNASRSRFGLPPKCLCAARHVRLKAFYVVTRREATRNSICHRPAEMVAYRKL